jgi:hypothetical protein
VERDGKMGVSVSPEGHAHVGAPTALLASPLFTAKPEGYGDRVLAVSVVLIAVTLGEGRSMNIPSQISNALVTVSV